MISEAKELLSKENPETRNITYVVDDILTYPYEPADFIVAYYTVQFVHPRSRQDIFDRIYQSLNWGGSFLLFEKVRGPDARFQDIISSIYTDYKLDQGYEPADIIAKARSLKGVLEPFSTNGNMDMLKWAGFDDIMTIFKHVCLKGSFVLNDIMENYLHTYLESVGIVEGISAHSVDCEVCGHHEHELLVEKVETGPDRFARLPIVACTQCGYIFQNPRFNKAFSASIITTSLAQRTESAKSGFWTFGKL
jgi:hypothetical protein